jgi:hypothetical protein
MIKTVFAVCLTTILAVRLEGVVVDEAKIDPKHLGVEGYGSDDIIGNINIRKALYPTNKEYRAEALAQEKA